MSIIDELANSQITGVVLFFIGLLIAYLFIRFFTKVIIHYTNER